MNARVPNWLENLLRRPAAVFGAGVSGRAASALIADLGGRAVIYDRDAADPAERTFDETIARGYGLVVLSPAFALDHPWVQAAHSAGCEVLAELDLAALAWPGEIVAVTGTNGKTTATEFLCHALRQTGRQAYTVGNIGAAFSAACGPDIPADAIAICEVSSFQAETLRFFEAGATLWTNFAEDHLERHPSLEAYFRAKYNLFKRTRGRAIFFGPTVWDQARELGLDLPVSGAVPFAGPEVAPEVAGTVFERLPQRENYLLVRALWRHWGLPSEALAAAAGTFLPGPHRLARVGSVDGVTFWNDSKGTNFHAVEAALASFDRPVLWIGGGRSKGGDIAAFAGRIAPRIRQAFVIGETRDLLAQHLRQSAVAVWPCDSLTEAVTQALAAASAGDHVVLSPGFASFDMFESYADRGRRFEKIVTGLAAERAAGSGQSLSSPLNPTIIRPATAGLLLS